MNAEEKAQSVLDLMTTLPKLKLKSNTPEEEKVMIARWVAETIATVYEHGFKDGRNSK